MTDLSQYLTVQEAVQPGRSRQRVMQLIADGRIPNTRKATIAEMGELLIAGRIRGFTPQGVMLIPQASMENIVLKPLGGQVTTGAGLRRKDRRNKKQQEEGNHETI